MESKIKIEGLDCANCALELEEEISKIKGVEEASVSFVNQIVNVTYDTEETLIKVKNVCNNFEEVKVVEDEEIYSFKIEGLDCANCALELEEEISKVEGVKEANVDFVNQKVKVTCLKKSLLKVKDVCNHFEKVKVVENNKKTSFKIEGLDCANCALELEEEISKIKGVEEASVSFVNQIVNVTYDTEETLIKVKNVCNNFEEVKVVEEVETFTFKIEGLDCANCALELEEEISKVEGVKEANVDFVNQKVKVICSKEQLLKVKDVCNNFEEVKVIEESKTKKVSKLTPENKHNLILIIIAAVIFVVAVIFDKVLTNDNNKNVFTWISLALYLVSYFVVGYPILWKTIKNVSKGKIFDENFLMTIASIGAMAINERIEGVAVMLLYQIGELLQSIAVNSSRSEIVSMMNLKSETATLIQDDKQIVVDPSQLKIDDIILIKNGEKVPVDAVIIEGNTSFDTKSLTGEALPKECHENEEILSGYINVGSVIKARVNRTYENSTVSKILDLVENSTSKKANPEKFITKFSRIYTPVVCILALVIAFIVPLIIALVNGNWSWNDNFSGWFYKSLTLLVISCPCALIISIPLSYFNGLGACANKGALVKGATYLDTLSKVDIACYDKTGTLTEGTFKIKKVYGEDRVLKIASSIEKGSNHPIARAFDEIESDIKFDSIEEIAGFGLIGKIGKDRYVVGNYKLLDKEEVKYEKVESISTIIYVAENHKLLGYIEIDDIVKKEVKNSLQRMKALGVNKQIMLTGDNKKRAEYVANELSLDGVYSELLPDQKLEKAEELKKQGTLLYVGDGINDAPVMVLSDVAFSMGKLGSDAAVEASDVVLVTDNFDEIPDTIKIAKKTKKIVIENIVFSILMKVLFMILGLVGLPLIVAVFADVGVMLICVINSIRVRLNGKK